MLIVGIDGGLTGAVAWLSATMARVVDTPTLIMQRGKKQVQEYDVPGMAALLLQHREDIRFVAIEDSQAMPRQGVSSTWKTGYGFGLWLGIIVALGLPYQRIRAATWKKAMQLTADKEHARLKAQQLFPDADLRLRKHHGRAEALLLAWYARHMLLGEHDGA